jgi:glutathione S-transferase
MDAVLFALPASHPCAAVERALALKEVAYRRVELIPGPHRIVQKAVFGATTVPAVRLSDGTKIVGSRSIMRELDARVPEPRLVPESAGAARAEEWGDQVLQSLVRRVVWAALVRAPGRVMGYTVDAKLLVPRPVARLSAPLIARLAAKLNDASDPNVRADLRALPHHLDRIDGWIEDGSLAEDAIAGRLQVGSGLRLLMTLEDVRPLIDRRPAGRMARDVFPVRAGSVGAGVLPSGWLP